MAHGPARRQQANNRSKSSGLRTSIVALLNRNGILGMEQQLYRYTIQLDSCAFRLVNSVLPE